VTVTAPPYREHPAQAVPPGRILRYSFRERLVHWLAGLSYVYCLLTGLAFWSPWLFWLAIALGGGQISRMLHPWIGLLFIAGVLQMYGLWARQMGITDDDRAWFRSVPHYIRNEDEKMPPVGRYNAGQKLLFWGFFVCGILLFLSGLVLWFPEYIPWSLRWLRYTAILIHASTALLTIGLFLIHVYMGVFAERGALDSVIYGDVTEDFARRFHPAWYKELFGSAPRRK
jgi:formate dehydrogenase subunit gamma